MSSFSFEKVAPVHAPTLTPYYQAYRDKLASLLRSFMNNEDEVERTIEALVRFMKSFAGQSVVAAYGSARDESPANRSPIVSNDGEAMLASIFNSIAIGGCGLTHGAAGNGYMGAIHRQWGEAIRRNHLSRANAPEYLVPLGLSPEYRAKEPYLDLWENPVDGVFACPEIPHLDLRWELMNYPRMLLGALVTIGGFGTLKELLDTVLARQLKSASLTPFSFKHHLVEELGWSKDDSRLKDLDPKIVVLDEWMNQPSAFVPMLTVSGWYYGDSLQGLIKQLERGTISEGDLSRIRVIRVGQPNTDAEKLLLKYGEVLNVRYFESAEGVGPYVAEELYGVYQSKRSLFEELNVMRAA